MGTTTGEAGAAIKPAANKRPAHGLGKISFGPSGPSGSGETAIAFPPLLRHLLGIVKPHRITVAVTLMLAIGTAVMSTLGPKILGAATDLLLVRVVDRNMPVGVTKGQAIEATHSGGNDTPVKMLQRVDFAPGQGIDFGAIGSILMLVLVLYVTSAIAAYVLNWLLIDTAQELVRRMRSDMGAKLQRLPLLYSDGQPRGGLLSRVTNDIGSISQTLMQILPQLVNSLLMVFGVVIIMMWISQPSVLVTLVSIPLSILIVPLIMRRSRRRLADMWKSTGELNPEIEETYTGHSLMKVFGRESEVKATFRTRNGALLKSSLRAQLLSEILMPVMFLVGNLSYIVVAIFDSLQMATGQMNIGDVRTFIQYLRQFTQPLTQLASVTNLLQSGVISTGRVFELLDADEVSPEPGRGLTAEGGHVIFEDVTLSYNPDRPLVERLNLEAKPGQTVAIVDPTGADKTTLMNLLMRFYDLNPGRILLDGTDITTVDRRTLRDNMGMVLQGTWLFGGTIRDNIACDKEGATQEEILAAAKTAFVDRFIHSLPDGYDTIINEESDNVSTGEKQLITIARAFLSEPEPLILDEATSSIDTRTGLLLRKAMTALRSGRTSLVIAHRLSTVCDADLILVMDDGTIVGRGTHSDLLAARGHYHDLYRSQLDTPVEGVPAP